MFNYGYGSHFCHTSFETKMWPTWQNCDLFNENVTGLINLWLCDRCDKIVTGLMKIWHVCVTKLWPLWQNCNWELCCVTLVKQVTILSHWSQSHKQIKLASFSLNKSQFCHTFIKPVSLNLSHRSQSHKLIKPVSFSLNKSRRSHFCHKK